MSELALANRAADWRRLKALVLDSVSSPITKTGIQPGLRILVIAQSAFDRSPGGVARLSKCYWKRSLDEHVKRTPLVARCSSEFSELIHKCVERNLLRHAIALDEAATCFRLREANISENPMTSFGMRLIHGTGADHV